MTRLELHDIIEKLSGHDQAQRERIQHLEERLEIDHCFVFDPDDPLNLIRKELKPEERVTFPDKIVALEADVQLRDEEIEAQREEIESLRQDRDMFYHQLDEYWKLLLKRDEEIARLREALKFYANPQTYGMHGGSVNRAIHDAGRIAQAALEKEATRDKVE